VRAQGRLGLAASPALRRGSTHRNQQRSLQFLQSAQGPDGHRELLELIIIHVSGMESRAVISAEA
jgi:hypothetical protein